MEGQDFERSQRFLNIHLNAKNLSQSKQHTTIVTEIRRCALAVSLVLGCGVLMSGYARGDSISHGGEQLYTQEDRTAGSEISRMLRYKIDGIFAEDALYYTLLSEAGEEIVDKEQFTDFLVSFGGILKFLNENAVLTVDDLIAAMNVYTSFFQKDTDIESYANAYDKFIQGYPNPDLRLIELLEHYGYAYHELI